MSVPWNVVYESLWHEMCLLSKFKSENRLLCRFIDFCSWSCSFTFMLWFWFGLLRHSHCMGYINTVYSAERVKTGQKWTQSFIPSLFLVTFSLDLTLDCAARLSTKCSSSWAVSSNISKFQLIVSLAWLNSFFSWILFSLQRLLWYPNVQFHAKSAKFSFQ